MAECLRLSFRAAKRTEEGHRRVRRTPRKRRLSPKGEAKQCKGEERTRARRPSPEGDGRVPEAGFRAAKEAKAD